MISELEREENAIQAEYDHGEITLAEYNKALRELHRDFRAAANAAAVEEAERARQEELDRW